MQFSNKFTISIHVIVAIEYFKNDYTITSSFLSKTTGANPVVIRTIMSLLKDSNIIDISQGKTGISLKRDISDITFYDIYRSIDILNEEGLFNFHDNPSKECPVGRNIHKALDSYLLDIEKSMELKMKSITIKDVYNNVLKELSLENK